jgi:transcriptional regulator with XRE-family HTH domain
VKELKRLREMSGLSQFSVARMSGVERTRLSLAECGHVALTTGEKESLRRVLLQAVENRQSQLQAVLLASGPLHA